MRANLKKVGMAICAPVVVVLMPVFIPVFIWGVTIGCIRLANIERRKTKSRAAAEQYLCRIDTDCPPGHQCINGTCVPIYASND